MRFCTIVICFLGLGFGQAVGQTLEVTADDLLRFDPTSVEVTAGASVTLLFKNKGRIASQKHQLIILKAGVDVDQFGNELLGSDGELSSKLQSQVLVASKLLGPGEEERLTFTVPEPGTYTFICGFPGHHSASRGLLKVR